MEPIHEKARTPSGHPGEQKDHHLLPWRGTCPFSRTVKFSKIRGKLDKIKIVVEGQHETIQDKLSVGVPFGILGFYGKMTPGNLSPGGN